MVQRLVILLTALFCAACAGPVMSRAQFNSVQFGDTQDVLVSQHGTPYEVKQLSGGMVEYHYIERVPIRPDMAEEHHYYFVIKDGKVLSKRTTCNSGNVDLHFNG